MTGGIRAVIVDDEPVARRVLREELELLDHTSVVGEAGDGHSALQLIEKLHPDLVFADLQMPVMDGFGFSKLGLPSRLPTICNARV